MSDKPEKDRLKAVAICSTMQGLCMLDRVNSEEVRTLIQQGAVLLGDLPSDKQSLYAVKLRMYAETDLDRRKRLAEQQLAIALEGELRWSVPLCMVELGNIAFDQGDWAAAQAWALKAIDACGGTRFHANTCQAILILSRVAMIQQEYTEAQQWALEALANAEAAGIPPQIAWSHSMLGDIARLQRNYVKAQYHYQESLAICQALNDRLGSIFELNGLGSAASGLGDDETARHYLHDALRIAQELDDEAAMVDVLTGVAERLVNIGEQNRAAQIHDFVLSHPASVLITRDRATRLLPSLNSDLPLDEDRKSLELDRIVQEQLAELSQPPRYTSHATSPPLPNPLTERELEVLRYIAAGLSNYEIATRLFVGVSTIKTHINHLYSKLCVKSRTQAIACARELDLI